MRPASLRIGALLLLSATAGVNGEGKGEAPAVAWGEAVNGVQLGISPAADSKDDAEAPAGGRILRVDVHLRNVGKAPVRLLASVHGCLAMGPEAAVLVSNLVIQPEGGGRAATVSYRGWNHALLLDKRRPKGKGWQETLCKSKPGKPDFDFSAEDAKYLSTELAPGGTAKVQRVVVDLGKDSQSVWRVDDARAELKGKHQVTAVLTVDQKRSEWKGEVKSGPLHVTFHP